MQQCRIDRRTVGFYTRSIENPVCEHNGSADVLDYGADMSVFDCEDALADASREPDWHNPVWRRADGSVAEW